VAWKGEIEMHAGVMVFSGAAFVLIGFALVGGPMILVDRLRRRRQMAIERQIALTNAIDAQMGAIVSPVVARPLFSPWEIRIAVPFHRSATVAGILSVVDEVFQDVEGAGGRPYRVFLTARPDIVRETRPPSSTKRWAGGPVATA
jgi:hypothetical protein